MDAFVSTVTVVSSFGRSSWKTFSPNPITELPTPALVASAVTPDASPTASTAVGGGSRQDETVRRDSNNTVLGGGGLGVVADFERAGSTILLGIGRT